MSYYSISHIQLISNKFKVNLSKFHEGKKKSLLFSRNFRPKFQVRQLCDFGVGLLCYRGKLLTWIDTFTRAFKGFCNEKNETFLVSGDEFVDLQ